MNDAVYVSSVNKIYGTNGPYVIQYNATTGAREGYVRVGAPLYGEIRITYHAATSSLYVATWNRPSRQFFGTFFPTDDVDFREVYPVSTGLVVGAHLALGTIVENLPPYGGFQWITSNGNYLYVVYSQSNSSGGGAGSRYLIMRVDPTNISDNASTNLTRFRPEHGAISPTHVASPNPSLLANNSHLQFWPHALGGSADEVYVLPNNPCAVEYCAANGLFYAVCGTDTLIRVDTITPFSGTFTELNLGAVEASADPCRIRYNSGNGLLYLPCMTANGIIVWNPNTDTGVFKSGFDNPVDVIFTGSKIWAVQNAMVRLKEVT